MKMFSNSSACKVCEGTASVRKIRVNGLLICEACRKFFARNSSNINLLCIANDLQCAVNRSKIEDPTRKRPLNCPKCRLTKCLEVGMVAPTFSQSNVMPEMTSVTGQNESRFPLSPTSSFAHSPSSSSSGSLQLMAALHQQQSPITTSPPLVPLSEQPQEPPVYRSDEDASLGNLRGPEIAINGSKVVQSLMTSIGVLQRLPYVPLNLDVNSTSVSSIWPAFSNYFSEFVSICTTFIKQLPGFLALPLEDRQVLFKSSLFSLCLAQSAQPNSTVNPMLGQNDTTRAIMAHFFPIFRSFEDRAFEIAAAMAQWKPSFAEFSLLQALIYYKRPDPNILLSMARPDIAIEMHDSLMSVMRQLIANIDANNQESRWHHFNFVYNLLILVNQCFEDWAMEVASRYPDVYYNDALFAETFSH